MDFGIIEQMAGPASGAVIVVVAYLKIIAKRLDRIDGSIHEVLGEVADLRSLVQDHEVRIRVIECLDERERKDKREDKRDSETQTPASRGSN